MKICFITPTIFNLGGVQRVVSILASELTQYYEVDVICTSKEYSINTELYNLDKKVNIIFNENLLKRNFLQKVKRKGYKIINKLLDSEKIYLEINYPVEFRKKLIKYFNLNRYDIVIGVEGDYSILLAMISDKISSKTIGWMHNSFEAYFESENKYYWGQKKIFKENLNKLSKCIVLTNDDKKLYKKNFNIEVKDIYNPLSFKSEIKSSCLNKNILFVGRLVKEQKGLDYLMDIFSRVSANNSEWNLIIVGDGNDKEFIERYIEENSLEDRIKLYPHTNKILDFYLESSIFVSTSRWEGFGLVITEAMECGVPVIAFNNSGPKEIINKNYENGILIEKYDIRTFAIELENLINNYDFRKSISNKSIFRANDFSRKNIVAEWKMLIDKL